MWMQIPWGFIKVQIQIQQTWDSAFITSCPWCWCCWSWKDTWRTLVYLGAFQTLVHKSTQIIWGSCKKYIYIDCDPIELGILFFFFQAPVEAHSAHPWTTLWATKYLCTPNPKSIYYRQRLGQVSELPTPTFIDNYAMMWYLKLPLKITKIHLWLLTTSERGEGQGWPIKLMKLEWGQSCVWCQCGGLQDTPSSCVCWV